MPEEIKKRLTGGLIISLLIHAFVLSLQFGLPGLGLPELEAPWNKRRAETPAISIQIANPVAPSAPAPADNPPASPVNPVSSALASAPVAPPLPTVPSATPPAPVPPVTATERNESKQAVAGIQLVAPQKAAPVPALVPAKAANKQRASKKNTTDAAPPVAKTRKVQAPDVPRLITQDAFHDDSFVVAIPNPDEIPKKAEAETEPKKQFDDMTQEGIDQEQEQEKIARAAEQEKKRKLREEKMRKQVEELAQQNAADATKQNQQLAKQLDEDNRKQADEATRQLAAALALQKQLEAEEQNRRAQQDAARAEEVKLAEQKRQVEQKQQEEQRQQVQLAQATQADQAAKAAQQLQAQKEQQLREQQQREQQAREQQLAMEARKQEEQRQQAAVARQKQADEQLAKTKAEEQLAKQRTEELAARQKTEEQARQRAEQVAAEQGERELAQAAATKLAAANAAAAATAAANAAANAAAANAAATSAANAAAANQNQGQSTGPNANASGSNPGGSTSNGDKAGAFVLPKSLLGSDLANRAREQARGLDLLRGSPPAASSNSEDKPRRRSVFGSMDKDVPVQLYIDSWKQKIERNGNLNYSQVSKDRARGDPVVTVSIRSDGSIEDITINRSSGRADIDEAARRIIRLNAKYAAFPPNIAARYDVIEIRRIWNFDEKLRIIEELR
ncbi:TonB family protein [Undibacterium sp. Ji50W]|uniref:TonB family protein n=1 Tax=Undibacterium sp. Ji50W TaxID=3413041 RepID=UPI003BF125F7